MRKLCAAMLVGAVLCNCPGVLMGAYGAEETVALYGDVDENGAVTIADVVKLARYVSQDADVTVSEQGIRNGDCNGDGQCDNADVTAIARFLANMLTAEQLQNQQTTEARETILPVNTRTYNDNEWCATPFDAEYTWAKAYDTSIYGGNMGIADQPGMMNQFNERNRPRFWSYDSIIEQGNVVCFLKTVEPYANTTFTIDGVERQNGVIYVSATRRIPDEAEIGPAEYMLEVTLSKEDYHGETVYMRLYDEIPVETPEGILRCKSFTLRGFYNQKTVTELYGQWDSLKKLSSKAAAMVDPAWMEDNRVLVVSNCEQQANDEMPHVLSASIIDGKVTMREYFSDTGYGREPVHYSWMFVIIPRTMDQTIISDATEIESISVYPFAHETTIS